MASGITAKAEGRGCLSICHLSNHVEPRGTAAGDCVCVGWRDGEIGEGNKFDAL